MQYNNVFTQGYDFIRGNYITIVIEVDSKIVSLCNLSIIKNLTLNMAIDIAEANDCYKVMLLTGSKKDETLRFYEQVGVIKGLKTGFIKNL